MVYLLSGLAFLYLVFLLAYSFICMAYLVSKAFRMVYLLHEVDYLVFGMKFMVFSSHKIELFFYSLGKTLFRADP